jgi:hypothetical protein
MAGSAPSAEDGTNGDPAGYPAGVLAAAVLATTGVSFVLVGSAALWLRGEPIPVGDADVVIEPELHWRIWLFSLTLPWTSARPLLAAAAAEAACH